ncbi:MAG: glycosyltransferase [Pirellulales bacterium]
MLYVDSLGLRRPTVNTRDLTRIGRRLLRGLSRPRQVEPNLWVFSPLVLPWHNRVATRRLNERVLAGALQRVTRQLGFRRPIVWTYNPLVEPLISRLDASLVVYHCVDDLGAVPGAPTDVIEACERRITADADLVLTTSRNLQRRLEPLNPAATSYLPNVADYEHFSTARADGPLPEDLRAIPRPRIGFIGAVSHYKVDFELVAEVARRRPDWHWVLIGQVGEGQPQSLPEVLDAPNVHLLGPRSYGRLPDYLRGFDVATIPARVNPYTESMFPMKFFEYLAAGCSVVASNVPALDEFSHACQLVAGADDFTAAIARVLAGGGPDMATRDELARRHTWTWRAQEIHALIEARWAEKNRGRDRGPVPRPHLTAAALKTTTALKISTALAATSLPRTPPDTPAGTSSNGH